MFPANAASEIAQNNFRSLLLLAAFPLLLLGLVWVYFAIISPIYVEVSPGDYAPLPPIESGLEGLARHWHKALLIAGGWLVIAYLFHSQMINAATGAVPLERSQAPEIYAMVERLSREANMKSPKIQLMETDALNAFASGISEKNFALTLTSGIISALDREELEAVIAHELSHIRHRDVRLLIISIIFVGMISFLCQFVFRSLLYGGMGNRNRQGRGGFGMVVAFLALGAGYLFSLLIRFAISRKRELMADAGAVEIARNPTALASALRKISGRADIPSVPADVKQLFIENAQPFMGFFATHPPIEQRIAQLEALGAAPSRSRNAGPWEQTND